MIRESYTIDIFLNKIKKNKNDVQHVAYFIDNILLICKNVFR